MLRASSPAPKLLSVSITTFQLNNEELWDVKQVLSQAQPAELRCRPVGSLQSTQP